MLCTFCNAARLDNEAPCPHCGAPSPLLGKTHAGTTQNLGTGAMPPLAGWGDTTSSFSQVQAANAQKAQMEQPFSLLPVPYQPQQLPFTPLQQNNMQLSVPTHQPGAMLPALPEDESAIYVPPMYTKPRPIIPRYRAISGFLSILIVMLALCGGVGYYVKASGKLAALGQFTGVVLPANVKPAPTLVLPDPPKNPDFGPAYSTINSATTNSRIDPISHASAQPENIFQLNQTIYLTYSVQRPKTPGVMTIKWFTNGAFYQAPSPIPVSNSPITGYTTQKYTQPAEGKVELYWNDQLAIRLYFVVR